MTLRERAAFNAGVEAMRQMAMIAAITIETREDAREVRQQAAAAELQGLSEGARAWMLMPPRSKAVVYTLFRAICGPAWRMRRVRP